jgi:UDP-N-acetylbacillosamine N-acetyltransferase
MKPKLIIWGAGGHAMVVADIVQQIKTYEIIAFVDDVNTARRSFLGLPVITQQKKLGSLLAGGTTELIVAVGDCQVRLGLALRAKKMGFRLALAIHPRAIVSPTATIGRGSVIVAGAVINPQAAIGENVIINTGATIDHQCVIEDGVHICPGVHLAGKVTVGRGSWIGIGSTIIDNIRIGTGAFIGAGGVVVNNIPAGVLAVGLPAKVVRKL